MKQSCRAEILWGSYPCKVASRMSTRTSLTGDTQDEVERTVPCLHSNVWFPAENKRQWFAPLLFQGIRDPAGLRREGQYLPFCFSRWRGIYTKMRPAYHLLEDFSIQKPHSFRDGEKRNFPKGQTCLSHGSVSSLSSEQHNAPLEKERAELAVW